MDSLDCLPRYSHYAVLYELSETWEAFPGHMWLPFDKTRYVVKEEGKGTVCWYNYWIGKDESMSIVVLKDANGVPKFWAGICF